MTTQEAIRRIKNHIEVHSRKEPHFAIHIIEAVKMAIAALEKQMPKKVIPFKRTAHDFQSNICKHSGYPCEHIKTFNNEYQYTDYKCPHCNKRVSDGNPKHCDKCGQALDWSES